MIEPERAAKLGYTFTKCSVCGGKAYCVGTKDNFNEHCWDCGNEDHTIVVDFSDKAGWRPTKRID